VVARIGRYDARLDRGGAREKARLLAESPFSFYRGTAHLFWRDAARGSAGPFVTDLRAFGGTAAHRTWICGDLHLNNLGVFHDADGRTVFGINDFDEAVIADWQLDLWRLVPSLVLAARQEGRSPRLQAALVGACVRAYLHAMGAYRGNERALTRAFTADTTSGAIAGLVRARAAVTRAHMLERWTEERRGARVLASATNLELAPLHRGERTAILSAWPRYLRRVAGGADVFAAYAPLGLARRLGAGLGARGLNRYYCLVAGPGVADGERILDLKYQGEPAPWAHLDRDQYTVTAAACRGNHALRTVIALRACNHCPDVYAGWLRLEDGTYAVRERSPAKAMLPPASLDAEAAAWFGTIAATAHARANLRVVEAVCASTLRRVDAVTDALTRLAIAYADQVERDHAAYRDHLEVTEALTP
jgi:uncharacterized protein (DUF2252 family)